MDVHLSLAKNVCTTYNTLKIEDSSDSPLQLIESTIVDCHGKSYEQLQVHVNIDTMEKHGSSGRVVMRIKGDKLSYNFHYSIYTIRIPPFTCHNIKSQHVTSRPIAYN